MPSQAETEPSQSETTQPQSDLGWTRPSGAKLGAKLGEKENQEHFFWFSNFSGLVFSRHMFSQFLGEPRIRDLAFVEVLGRLKVL